MNRSQLRGDLPEPVSRYFDDIALLQPPADLLSAAADEIERTPQASRFSPLPFVGLAAAAAIGIALLFSGFFSSAPLKFGSDETPVSTPTKAPTPEPLAVVGADGNPVEVDAFRLAEGEGTGGPWSYWLWTAHCAPSGLTVLYQWVEYEPLRGGVGLDLDQCHGGDSREQPYVVERSGVGDDGWSFLYGQTQLDVVRVKVRLVDGREFETDTIAAPDGLDWNARFYVMLLPVEFGEIDTVRGYNASGQDVGGDWEPGEGAP
jgi:hypothetical protein